MEAIFIQSGSGIVEYILQNKDVFAVIFGLLALIVSGITLGQKVTEVRRTLRSQATDVLSKLDTASIDLVKVRIEYNSSTDKSQIGGELDRVKRAISALAHRAIYLVRQIPHLISDVEYANLALAFDSVGDYLMADIYWGKALSTPLVESPWYRRLAFWKKSPEEAHYSKITKAIHLRRYANFLHYQGKEKDGDQKFYEAFDLLKDISDDQAIWELGFAYRKFAQSKIENRRKGISQAEFLELKNLFCDFMLKAADEYKILFSQKRVDLARSELIEEVSKLSITINLDSTELRKTINTILNPEN